MKGEKVFVLGSNELSFEQIEVKGIPKCYLKTTISTGDVDLVNDVVTEKCMESMIRQLKERTIKLDFEHEAFRGDSLSEQEFNKTRIPLGKRISFERGAKGVDVTWELNQSWKKFDVDGRVVFDFNDVKSNIENGYYDGTSIAYIPTSIDHQMKGENKIRLLDDLILLNVALTGNPVNTHAVVREIFTKSLDHLKSKEGEKEKRKERMDEEDEEEEDSDTEKEKESGTEKKNHTLTKLKGEENMSEEEQAVQTPVEEAQAEAPVEPVAEPVAETEAKAEEEAKEEATPEEPAKEDAEVKSLKGMVESLSKQVADLKSQLEAPLRKAVQEEAKIADVQQKSCNPLDLIGN